MTDTTIKRAIPVALLERVASRLERVRDVRVPYPVAEARADAAEIRAAVEASRVPRC